MASKLIQNSDDIAYNVCQYVCDEESDIDLLPRTAAMGSSAIVIATGEVYMLNSSRQWIKL